MEDKSFRSLVLLQERIARRVREGTEYSTEKRGISLGDGGDRTDDGRDCSGGLRL